MIKIAHDSPQKVWMPIKPGATIYVGSLVSIDFSALDEGVVVRPTAVGIANTTNKDIPLGVCVGTNRREPIFSATYLAEYITDPGVTGVRTDTTEYVLKEGPWNKGDGMAMVEVALIDPSTVLSAPIRNGAIGTSISELTSSAGNANGLTVTTGAADFTPVANLCTIYCRAGVNRGQYRTTDSTSTTVHAWDREMLKTTAGAGEKYVMSGLRTHGVSYVTIGDGTVSSFIDGSATQATNYDVIQVVRLDLSDPGNEFVEFRFDTDAFCQVRA